MFKRGEVIVLLISDWLLGWVQVLLVMDWGSMMSFMRSGVQLGVVWLLLRRWSMLELDFLWMINGIRQLWLIFWASLVVWHTSSGLSCRPTISCQFLISSLLLLWRVSILPCSEVLLVIVIDPWRLHPYTTSTPVIGCDWVILIIVDIILQLKFWYASSFQRIFESRLWSIMWAFHLHAIQLHVFSLKVYDFLAGQL